MERPVKFLIAVFIGLFACADDDEATAKFSTDVLLMYNWEFVSGSKDGRIVATIGQPFPTLHIEHDVIAFAGTPEGGEVMKVVGEANFVLGSWQITGKTLTINGSGVQIKKLTKKELVYSTTDNYTIYRNAIAK